jgi:hypothetical protein
MAVRVTNDREPGAPVVGRSAMRTVCGQLHRFTIGCWSLTGRCVAPYLWRRSRCRVARGIHNAAPRAIGPTTSRFPRDQPVRRTGADRWAVRVSPAYFHPTTAARPGGQRQSGYAPQRPFIVAVLAGRSCPEADLADGVQNGGVGQKPPSTARFTKGHLVRRPRYRHAFTMG